MENFLNKHPFFFRSPSNWLFSRVCYLAYFDAYSFFSTSDVFVDFAKDSTAFSCFLCHPPISSKDFKIFFTYIFIHFIYFNLFNLIFIYFHLILFYYSHCTLLKLIVVVLESAFFVYSVLITFNTFLFLCFLLGRYFFISYSENFFVLFPSFPIAHSCCLHSLLTILLLIIFLIFPSNLIAQAGLVFLLTPLFSQFTNFSSRVINC